MKRADKSAMANRNYFELISELSDCKILSLQEMICVRGGDGEGGGGEPIILIPKEQ